MGAPHPASRPPGPTPLRRSCSRPCCCRPARWWRPPTAPGGRRSRARRRDPSPTPTGTPSARAQHRGLDLAARPAPSCAPRAPAACASRATCPGAVRVRSAGPGRNGRPAASPWPWRVQLHLRTARGRRPSGGAGSHRARHSGRPRGRPRAACTSACGARAARGVRDPARFLGGRASPRCRRSGRRRARRRTGAPRAPRLGALPRRPPRPASDAPRPSRCRRRRPASDAPRPCSAPAPTLAAPPRDGGPTRSRLAPAALDLTSRRAVAARRRHPVDARRRSAGLPRRSVARMARPHAGPRGRAGRRRPGPAAPRGPAGRDRRRRPLSRSGHKCRAAADAGSAAGAPRRCTGTRCTGCHTPGGLLPPVRTGRRCGSLLVASSPKHPPSPARRPARPPSGPPCVRDRRPHGAVDSQRGRPATGAPSGRPVARERGGAGGRQLTSGTRWSGRAGPRAGRPGRRPRRGRSRPARAAAQGTGLLGRRAARSNRSRLLATRPRREALVPHGS